MDIKATILAAGIDELDIEDDSIEGCDHFYVYFENGLAVSILRGTHPTGRVLGDPSTGDVEAATLKVTFGGLLPYNTETDPLGRNLNAEKLTALLNEVKAKPALTLAEILGDAASIINL